MIIDEGDQSQTSDTESQEGLPRLTGRLLLYDLYFLRGTGRGGEAFIKINESFSLILSWHIDEKHSINRDVLSCKIKKECSRTSTLIY